jgi:hypothetical protein
MKKLTFSVFIAIVCLPMLSIGQGSLTLVINGTDAKCNGSSNGSATVTPSGGTSPYTYSWAPSGGTNSAATGLTVGTYSVTVTDNNSNVAVGTVTIGQPQPLLVSLDSIVVRPCFRPQGGSCGCNNTLWAITSGGTAPYSYAWTPNGELTDTIRGVCYEEFAVTVTDINLCAISDSIDILIPGSYPTGINELTNNNEIKLYPVPATNTLNISSGQWPVLSGQTVEVYDMMGKLVLKQLIDANSAHINLNVSGLANGNYLLRLVGTDSQKMAKFSISK